MCSLGMAGHTRAQPSVHTGMGALHLPCVPHPSPAPASPPSLWFLQVVAVSQGRHTVPSTQRSLSNHLCFALAAAVSSPLQSRVGCRP